MTTEDIAKYLGIGTASVSVLVLVAARAWRWLMGESAVVAKEKTESFLLGDMRQQIILNREAARENLSDLETESSVLRERVAVLEQRLREAQIVAMEAYLDAVLVARSVGSAPSLRVRDKLKFLILNSERRVQSVQPGPEAHES